MYAGRSIMEPVGYDIRLDSAHKYEKLQGPEIKNEGMRRR